MCATLPLPTTTLTRDVHARPASRLSSEACLEVRGRRHSHTPHTDRKEATWTPCTPGAPKAWRYGSATRLLVLLVERGQTRT